MELTLGITLKGESSCWIITRTSEAFNEYTSVVRISKEDKSQKVFVSFGTFVKDQNNDLIFKVFLKQQLIDFSSKYFQFLKCFLEIKNRSYYENDTCEVRAYILDMGEDKIITKLFGKPS